MSVVTFPVYSALCEVDRVAYERYLQSCDTFANCGYRKITENVGSSRLLLGASPLQSGVENEHGLSGSEIRVGALYEVGDSVRLRNGLCGVVVQGDGCLAPDGVKSAPSGYGECDERVDVCDSRRTSGSAACEPCAGDGGICSGATAVSDNQRDRADVDDHKGRVEADEAAKFVPGKHFRKNKRRQERNRAIRRDWREARVDGSGGCISDSGASVRTVDTRTAVEIEAAQTLAARRVVENKLAIAQGKARLRGYGDRAKTDAYDRLAEARMEQRINEAKAKSQASFKKCDESLKSLGSTGSAGEFAMRREVAKARESEAMLKYVQAQADILARHATPQTLALCNEVPPPERVNLFEIFGECSSDLSPDEIENYYEQIRVLEEEQDALFTTQFA